MSLKMMKKTMLVTAFLAMGSLSLAACGDDDSGDSGDKDAGASGGDEDGGGSGAKTRTWGGTLVQVLAQDTKAPILNPHEIVVLDNETGELLEGGKYKATTSDKDGTWSIKDVPMEKPIAFWLKGNAAADTYDAVTINVTYTTADEPLTRVSAAGTANIAENGAGYVGKPDTAGMSIGVYYVKDGKKLGIIGCVKGVLDDSPEKTEAADLRYVSAQGLPVPPSVQQKTETSRGAMLFGNMPTGKHTVKFTVDDGKTYFGETTVYITKARQDASSTFKSILYFIGIEVPEQKTPAGCM